ncbi:sigma-70 family RNA polymerase sigma factor [Patescibacteria group bacterium]|nr:MAG: sigma-70 family RNA polymerase sigma factor [Patescibacteria group bacterium]
MDRRAFDRFYCANIDRIYRYVRLRVPDEPTAEDLTSEIFLKALAAFDRYDEAVSRSAWIYRIAHNHLANWYRDRRMHVDLDDVCDLLVGQDGRGLEQRTDDQRLVARAFSALEPEERRLVTLKYLEGYGYADMAELLGRPATSLKMATHRVIKKLRGLL